jgi:hypothetical protein
MVAGLLVCGIALRLGLVLRRSRRFRTRREPGVRAAHLRFAKPAVAMVLLGFCAGPISAVWLRNWEPLRSFHGWLGVVATALFVAAAIFGHRLEGGRSRAFDAHALAGLLAMLAALVAAVAGFELTP